MKSPAAQTSSTSSVIKLLASIVFIIALVATPSFAQLPQFAGGEDHTFRSGIDVNQVRSSSRDLTAVDEPFRDRFIALQLVDDFKYLLGQSDFYLFVGGLSAAPSIFPRAFKLESPEFTELWGNSQFADNMFEGGEIIGQAAYPIAASAALWSVGRLTGRERSRAFGSDLFRAQAINGFFTIAMKGSINRTRPNGAPYGYPSGHTSSAFATAGVVYKHFGAKWGLPAFAIASYVGFSRLQENKHYLSDIVAGGILGGYLGLKIGGRRFAEHSFSISPAFSNDSRGIRVTARF